MLWIGSLVIVVVSNILSQDLDWLTLVAAMMDNAERVLIPVTDPELSVDYHITYLKK